MLREKLNTAVKQAVTAEGYCFHSGFAYRINNEICQFPAAWLLPLQLSAVDGRHDGFVTYKATLYLMHLERKPKPETKERQWDEMERAALRIIDRITFSERVFNVSGIRCTPEENTLSNHGEISLKLECDVRLRFCPDDLPEITD